MKWPVIPIRMKANDVIRIPLVGDWHWGSKACLEDLVKDFVKRYAGMNNTYLIDMGDEFDLIWRQDKKRFEPQVIHPKYASSPNMIGHMRRDFLKEMDPLRGMFVGACDSNHVAAYRKHSDFDLYDEFTTAMNAPKLGFGGYVIFRIKHKKHRSVVEKDIVFSVSHGKTSRARTIGGSINVVAKDGEIFQSHVIAHGHTHQLRVPGSRKWFEWSESEERPVIKRQRIAQTGSFLLTYAESEYDGYGAWRRYEPSDPGWAVAEITMDNPNSDDPRVKLYAEEFEL